MLIRLPITAAAPQDWPVLYVQCSVFGADTHKDYQTLVRKDNCWKGSYHLRIIEYVK